MAQNRYKQRDSHHSDEEYKTNVVVIFRPYTIDIEKLDTIIKMLKKLQFPESLNRKSSPLFCVSNKKFSFQKG